MRDRVMAIFVYHLDITGSLTGVEIEKGSQRVSGLTLNWTAIRSYKGESSP